MGDRRRIDPILEEVRHLLPADVAVVAVPADAGPAGRPAERVAVASAADAVGAARVAWQLLFPEQTDTPSIELRWVRSTDGRRAWAEASTARPVRLPPDDLDRTCRALTDTGWDARRSDRGRVRRVLAHRPTAALEIQVRPGTGIVALRARSAPVDVPDARPDPSG